MKLCYILLNKVKLENTSIDSNQFCSLKYTIRDEVPDRL